MNPRFALDSNILIYAEGAQDEVKRDIAIELVSRLGPGAALLPLQAAGETLRWLLSRGRLGRREAVQRIKAWSERCILLPFAPGSFDHALELVGQNGLQVWDAVILSACAEARADVMLSEDMQHGFSWRGVTIINPFILSSDERLELIPNRPLH
jgi:predicted nucleic acid-binding protein